MATIEVTGPLVPTKNGKWARIVPDVRGPIANALVNVKALPENVDTIVIHVRAAS